MSSGEATTYNHDAAVELAQAESICREWLPFSRDGEAICWVMVEYDRRGRVVDQLTDDVVSLVESNEQLRAQRAAALALADEWDAQHGGTNLSRKLREALGVEA